MIKPITPEEVVEAKKTTIPDFVFKIFNEEIAKSWDGRRAIIHQETVLRILRAVDAVGNGIYTDTIDMRWLNIESVYENAGWIVEYDKPAYNETYPATFTFTKRK